MKVLAFSDTHSLHKELLTDELKEKEAEVIICAGDFSSNNNNFYDFAEWFGKLNIKHKILIAGNHDEELHYNKDSSKYILKDNGIIYLEDSEIIIDNVKFYGSPWTPIYFHYSFMKTETGLKVMFNKIPDDTNVLITHGPAYKILDKTNLNLNVGSYSLKNKIETLKNLKHHVFGHIHTDFGTIIENDISFHNVSCILKKNKFLTEFEI